MLKKLFTIKPVGAMALMLLAVLVSGHAADALHRCYYTDQKSDTKCLVIFRSVEKNNNRAFSSTRVKCDKRANIKIFMELKQLSILGYWTRVDKDDVTNHWGRSAYVNVAAGCRYGSRSSWKSYTHVMVNGRTLVKLQTPGRTGETLRCSI